MVLSRIELPGDMKIQLTIGLRYLLSLLVNYKVCASLVSDSFQLGRDTNVRGAFTPLCVQ